MLGRELTCGFAVLGLTQVAQGTFVVAEVIEGDPCPVHGLEVVPLMAQHLQAVLLHSLVVDQLRLQQASCRDWRIGRVGGGERGLLVEMLKKNPLDSRDVVATSSTGVWW